MIAGGGKLFPKVNQSSERSTRYSSVHVFDDDIVRESAKLRFKLFMTAVVHRHVTRK